MLCLMWYSPVMRLNQHRIQKASWDDTEKVKKSLVSVFYAQEHSDERETIYACILRHYKLKGMYYDPFLKARRNVHLLSGLAWSMDTSEAVGDS